MKLNNDLIIIDLEATSNQETENERPEDQSNNFIIEMGAVHLRRDLTIGERFSRLVKPEERITPFIESLTGISNEMVADQPLWPEVYQDFQKWTDSIITKRSKIRLCAFGTYFDSPLFRKMCKHYNQKYVYSGTWIDVKTVAFTWAALSGHRTDEISVEKMAKIMEIEPEGTYHRAITDAVVEAKIMSNALWFLSNGMYVEDLESKKYRRISLTLN